MSSYYAGETEFQLVDSVNSSSQYAIYVDTDSNNTDSDYDGQTILEDDSYSSYTNDKYESDITEQKECIIKMNSIEFKKIKTLGSGAFKTVYLVSNNKGEEFALSQIVLPKAEREQILSKKYQPEKTKDPIKLFESEYNVMKQLQHNNLPKVIDFEIFQSKINKKGEDKSIDVYILQLLTEFVRGDTLESLRDKGPIPIQTLSLIIQQILSVLGYLHKKRIVHGDLKADNIIFDNEKKVLKLIDFGLAKTIPQDSDCSSGVIVFLPFADPMMLRGKGPLFTPLTDIYAFGCTILQIITGCKPQELRNNLIKDKLTIESIVEPFGVDNSLSSFIKSCLHPTHTPFPPVLYSEPFRDRPDVELLQTHPWFTQSDNEKLSSNDLCQNLYWATWDNNLDLMKNIFDNIKSKTLDNPSLLHISLITSINIASKMGNNDTIEWLLETFTQFKDIKINKAKKLSNPLHWASNYGHLESIKILIDKFPNAKTLLWDYDDHDSWCIDYAARNGYLNIVKFLLDQIKLNHPNYINVKRRIVHQSSCGNHSSLLTTLINENIIREDDINRIDNNGWSALLLASKWGSIDSIKVLLDNKADVNHTNKDQWSALTWSSLNGYYDIVNILISKKIDVNNYTKDGHSALITAADLGARGMVEILLKAKAEIDHVNKAGFSALTISSEKGNYAVCDTLIKHKAQVNILTKDEWSPLFWAVSSQRYEVCKLLLQSNANIEHVSKYNVDILKILMNIEKPSQSLISLLASYQLDFKKMRNISNFNIDKLKEFITIAQSMEINSDFSKTLELINKDLNKKVKIDFISKLKKLFKKKEREKRCLFLGLDASGKTSILYALHNLNQKKYGGVVNTIPTIGFNVETISTINGNITCWDVGGQDKIRPLWKHYYNNIDNITYFIDSNDKERLKESIEEIDNIIRQPEIDVSEILFVATKQDLPNAMSVSYIRDMIMQSKNVKSHLIGKKWSIHGVSINSNAQIKHLADNLFL